MMLACSEQPDPPAQAVQAEVATASGEPSGEIPIVQKGVFFRPDLGGFELTDEYDADGDGDAIKETHVRRYGNEAGDTAFSMTTGEHLWAWSLDTKDDDADIHKNYVVRDSNCDKVFDERYSLDAEFHVPACVTEADDKGSPGGM